MYYLKFIRCIFKSLRPYVVHKLNTFNVTLYNSEQYVYKYISITQVQVYYSYFLLVHTCILMNA